MSKTESKLKKLLLACFITIIGLFMTETAVQAVYFSGWQSGDNALWDSKEYYCIEHQDGFNGGYWEPISSETIRSDDTSQARRALAYILYEGEKSGNGGYNKMGTYQMAVWKWYYEQSGINTSDPGTSSLYDTAMSIGSIPYSNESAKITSSSRFTMTGLVGSIKLTALKGKVDSITIEWEDPADNKTYTQTISSGNSKVNNWAEIYSDSNCRTALKIDDISTNQFYIKNLKENYLIKNVKLDVKAQASGYEVTITRYRKADGDSSEQDLISASYQEGRDTDTTKTINAKYAYGNIKIKKQGVYKKDGKEQKETISATFKLYCKTLGKWVSGEAAANKVYVDDIQNASEFASGTKISKLFATYEYELVEVKVNNKYYNNPIKMVAAVSNKQGALLVGTKNNYYSANGIIVAKGATNKVTIDNERTSGDLTLVKKENKENKKITGAEFRLYLASGAVDKTTGWVVSSNGKADGTMSYVSSNGTDFKVENGELKVENLKFGTYKIYETKSPDDNIYELAEQEGYEADETSKLNHWVYAGEMKLDETKAIEIVNERTVGDLIVTKSDKNYNDKKLAGAEIRLYSVKEEAWVTDNTETNSGLEKAFSYNKNTLAEDAAYFITDENGVAEIKNLKLGKYRIYESKTPEGYDITKQEGYEADDFAKENHWILVDEVEVRENETARNEGTYSFNNIKTISLEGKVWEENPYTKSNGYNHIYDENGNDELLEGIKVELCQNDDGNVIATTHTDKNGYYKFEDLNYWDVANFYIVFSYDNTKYITVNPFTGTDVNINSKAQEYTINEKKLDDINLTGIEGENPGRAVTYKDKTNKMWSSYKEIEDDKDILTAYFVDETYTIEDINLGLVIKKDPNYSIKEELAYIKVKLNGYTYTYQYDKGSVASTNTNSAIESLYVPTTSQQTLTGFYTAQIYPSDVAYNAENGGDKLKLYVVYKITVNNDETENLNDNYVEQRLYLKSLTNNFDTSRYILANNENLNDEHGSEFGLWENSGTGTNPQGKTYGIASYKVNEGVFKNGIEKNSGEGMDNNAVSSYIQFRMKDDALKAILDGNTSDYNEEVVPTLTTAVAYHDYLRTDNIWDSNANVKSWRDDSTSADYTEQGRKNETNYSLTAPSSKKDFIHHSIYKEAPSYALYVHIKLGAPRAVEGTVFEDTKTREVTDNDGNKTLVGDGIFNNNENITRNVKVELLNAKSNNDYSTVADLNSQDENIADLYIKDDTNANHYSILKAQTVTGNDGKYSFVGVLPGVYYIRFTYGDGTQKIYNAQTGEEINVKAIDYTSTKISDVNNNQIINLVRDANKLSQDEINRLIDTLLNGTDDSQKEAARRKVEWYKFIQNEEDNTVYSTALDDLTLRATYENNVYDSDGTIQNSEDDASTIKAFTPATSISIENDTKDSALINTVNMDNIHKNMYSRFNLGIIKIPRTILIPEKRISNIDVTSQVGSTIISEQPNKSKAVYLSDLDKNTSDGSKYAKLEIDPTIIYGANLKVTYKITISNKSENDYIEIDGNNLGDYQNYGIFGENTKLKHVVVKEVQDLIDEKYRYDENQQIVTEESGKPVTIVSKKSEVSSESSSSEESITNEDGTTSTTSTQSLSITGFNEIVIGESETISYVVAATVNSSDEDLLYNNDVEIKQIQLDKLTTLQNDFNWEKSKTTFTITPPTGEDRDNLYWVVGVVALLTLASGIVLIKKKAIK